MELLFTKGDIPEWKKEEQARLPKCIFCWTPTANKDKICDNCNTAVKQ